LIIQCDDVLALLDVGASTDSLPGLLLRVRDNRDGSGSTRYVGMDATKLMYQLLAVDQLDEGGPVRPQRACHRELLCGRCVSSMFQHRLLPPLKERCLRTRRVRWRVAMMGRWALSKVSWTCCTGWRRSMVP